MRRGEKGVFSATACLLARLVVDIGRQQPRPLLISGPSTLRGGEKLLNESLHNGRPFVGESERFRVKTSLSFFPK